MPELDWEAAEVWDLSEHEPKHPSKLIKLEVTDLAQHITLKVVVVGMRKFKIRQMIACWFIRLAKVFLPFELVVEIKDLSEPSDG